MITCDKLTIFNMQMESPWKFHDLALQTWASNKGMKKLYIIIPIRVTHSTITALPFLYIVCRSCHPPAECMLIVYSSNITSTIRFILLNIKIRCFEYYLGLDREQCKVKLDFLTWV